MTRWTHGHTFASGVAGGLILDRHVLIVFFVGALLGAGVAYGGRFLRAAGHIAKERGGELHAATLARLEAETQRKVAAAHEAEAMAEHRSKTREQWRKDVDRAYREGVADGEHHHAATT